MHGRIIKRIILIVLMVGIVYSMGIATKSTLFAARQMQYKVIGQLEAEPAANIEAIFNKMGSEGWEFVQVYSDMAIFKR
jgi:hypothetical protein